MMKHLTPLVVLFAFTLGGNNASAEGGLMNSTPAQRADLQTAFMKDKLHLDEAALAKIKVINLKYAEKMEPILKGDDNKLSKMAKGKSVMGDKDEELKAVFSPDQYSSYEDLRDDLKAYLEKELK